MATPSKTTSPRSRDLRFLIIILPVVEHSPRRRDRRRDDYRTGARPRLEAEAHLVLADLQVRAQALDRGGGRLVGRQVDEAEAVAAGGDRGEQGGGGLLAAGGALDDGGRP